MAIEREIWLDTIVSNLFPDDSFVSKSVDLSGFVEGKTCHMPQAGRSSGVEENRSSFPATVKKRTDTLESFSMSSFTTDPMLLPANEKIWLSYDKRESVVAEDKSNLHNKIHESILLKWIKGAGRTIETTGTAAVAHTSTATGNRKKITKKEVSSAAMYMNQDNVPSAERYLLLDAIMYQELLEDLTDKELTAFIASANAQTGVVGKLYGFEVMMRSSVGVADSSKTDKSLSDQGAAGDLAVGLAWQKNSVVRALGETKPFANENDPQYYGDIISFETIAGGHQRRSDKKGIIRIIQSATA